MEEEGNAEIVQTINRTLCEGNFNGDVTAMDGKTSLEILWNLLSWKNGTTTTRNSKTSLLNWPHLPAIFLRPIMYFTSLWLDNKKKILKKNGEVMMSVVKKDGKYWIPSRQHKFGEIIEVTQDLISALNNTLVYVVDSAISATPAHNHDLRSG